MRAFIAIDLPIKLKKRIAQIQNELKDCSINAKWIKPENIHLTLKFLGNINQEELEKIESIISQTAQVFKSHTVTCQNFGFFPNQRKPRVFFISISNAETLKAMAMDLEEKLKTEGFHEANKATGSQNSFKAHITVARIKNTKNINSLKGKIEHIELNEVLPIEELILYESTLTQSGPIYKKLATRAIAQNKS